MFIERHIYFILGSFFFSADWHIYVFMDHQILKSAKYSRANKKNYEPSNMYLYESSHFPSLLIIILDNNHRPINVHNVVNVEKCVPFFYLIYNVYNNVPMGWRKTYMYLCSFGNEKRFYGSCS